MILYTKKYLTAKTKSYKEKFNINFHNNNILKEGSQSICWSVILINSVFRTGNNYYLQVCLEECKYVLEKKGCLSKFLVT